MSKAELYTYFPIKYPEIHDLYKKATACFWLVEEIDISGDKKDWANKLTLKEKEFIKYILAFFAASDGIVMENLGTRFFSEITNSEGRNFYAFQLAIEAVHSELYSLLIDTLITDSEEKEHLFSAVETMPVVRKKAQWAIKWTESRDASFAQRMVAFAIVEGVFFSGAFCSIYWLKNRGLMSGLSLSNDFISRDEGMHMTHACLQYNILKPENKLSMDVIHAMIREAVSIEDEFIDEALTFRLPGMNDVLMKQHIRSVADTLLAMLNVPKLYNVESPFDFMELLSLGSKANFFEGRNGEYQRSGILTKKTTTEEHLSMDVLREFAKEYGLDDKVDTWLKNRENPKASGTYAKKLVLNDDF